jgi:hypothetical protein
MLIFLSSPYWKRRAWQRGRRTVPGLLLETGKAGRFAYLVRDALQSRSTLDFVVAWSEKPIRSGA